MSFQYAGERILLTLWVGALWCIGYIAAPVLFATLDDRALAGLLAGKMFTVVTYLSFACGGILLLFQLLRPSAGRWRLGVLLGMLFAIAVGELVVRPQMAAAADTADFGRLHGLAQGIYLVVSLLGLTLVGFGLRPARDGI